MSLTPQMVELWERGFAACESQLRAIPIPSDEAAGRFYHIMCVLTDVARSNYQALRAAQRHDDQVTLAWACRNLLEIAVFSKYVLLSEKNAMEFAADRLIDALEIGVTLKKLQDSIDKEMAAAATTFPTQLMQATPKGADEIIDKYTNQLDQEQITRRRPLKMATLAKDVGLGDAYDGINKLCSKLVHPTSWSLFTAEAGPERFPEVSEIFYVYGALHYTMVLAEFLPHVRKWGLRHRPPATPQP